MEKDKASTQADDSPVFSSWNSWYLLVILVNLLIVAIIYFYIKTL
jgi:hypothetical protein